MPEVVRVADADPPRADRLRLVHRDGVRLGADDQPEAVVAVHGRRARQLADDADIRPRVDPAEGQHVEVGVQPGDAVRVDAPEVARRPARRRPAGVGARHAEVPEDTRGELVQTLDGVGLVFGDQSLCLQVKSSGQRAVRRSACRC